MSKLNDPDEARLPECARRWRENHATHADESDAIFHMTVCRGQLSTVAEQCLEWLATAPPALIAAASADAEVLREWQHDLDVPLCSAGRRAAARARIVDAADVYVLPKREVETWLTELDEMARVSRMVGDDAAGSAHEDHAFRLRALLSRETGKGEG